MPCYHPLKAWRKKSLSQKSINKMIGDIGYCSKKSVLDAYVAFSGSQITFSPADGIPGTEMLIPCGQCIGCRLEYSRQWAVRAIHEAKLHEQNCFITLTFNDKHLPLDKSIHVEDVQKFLKRLRKSIAPKKVRFMACGEYGTRFGRPHYHLLLFGFDFPDKVIRSKRLDNIYYVSPLLSKLWPFGYHIIGDVKFESAAYVARYILKKQKGLDEEAYKKHYGDRKKEFMTVSRRPGIAHDWIAKYKNDVYSRDDIVIRGKKHCRPPRYYDNYLELVNPVEYELVKHARYMAGLASKENPNNTAERLLEREFLKVKKLEDCIRVYENCMNEFE